MMMIDASVSDQVDSTLKNAVTNVHGSKLNSTPAENDSNSVDMRGLSDSKHSGNDGRDGDCVTAAESIMKLSHPELSCHHDKQSQPAVNIVDSLHPQLASVFHKMPENSGEEKVAGVPEHNPSHTTEVLVSKDTLLRDIPHSSQERLYRAAAKLAEVTAVTDPPLDETAWWIVAAIVVTLLLGAEIGARIVLYFVITMPSLVIQAAPVLMLRAYQGLVVAAVWAFTVLFALVYRKVRRAV
jgi:hypothetical protein